ncbi:MAG: hypothetical protein OHK006_12910 [Thermodesulfovibrionales bacterium]
MKSIADNYDELDGIEDDLPLTRREKILVLLTGGAMALAAAPAAWLMYALWIMMGGR